MTGAVSVAVAYAGASTGALAEASVGASAGASAEAVAVLAAVLVDWSIGHLVQCSSFFLYILARFCVLLYACMWVFC